MTGRPSTYTQETADAICERLSLGESLRSICRDDKMPGLTTVFGWLEAHEDFRAKYVRAREIQAEVLVDEMQEIADDSSNDWIEKRNADGEVISSQFNKEAAARSKIRLEQRRWFAEKLLPKKYGQRQHVELEASVKGSVSYQANIPKRED